MVQWLRIGPEMQGKPIKPLVRELRSHMHGATKPVCGN